MYCDPAAPSGVPGGSGGLVDGQGQEPGDEGGLVGGEALEVPEADVGEDDEGTGCY